MQRRFADDFRFWRRRQRRRLRGLGQLQPSDPGQLQPFDPGSRGGGKGLLPDGDILSLMQKLIKQRQESVELYDIGGRKELADQERTEIEIIKGFLPLQLSEAEAKEAIALVIQETGAAGMKDMGKVIAALKERYAGRMDFGKASALVKGLLTG